MYPNPKAIEELERLDSISLNRNPSNWNVTLSDAVKISSLNCRSLNKHYDDIKSDAVLLNSDLIALQETWLEESDCHDSLDIPGFVLETVSCGRGKGIATYYNKAKFTNVENYKGKNFQLSKFKSIFLDIITLYRSQDGNYIQLKDKLSMMINLGRPTLIIGDFNYCYLSTNTNLLRDFLNLQDFKQLIQEPTHIDGNIIDQAYLRDCDNTFRLETFLHSKYYSDHRGLAIIIKQGRE